MKKAGIDKTKVAMKSQPKSDAVLLSEFTWTPFQLMMPSDLLRRAAHVRETVMTRPFNHPLLFRLVRRVTSG